MEAVIGIRADNGVRSSRRHALASLLHNTGLISPLTLLRSALVRDLRILAYHRVVTVDDEDTFDFDIDLVSASAQQFREQMEFVSRRFHPIGFGDVIAAFERGIALPSRPVIVTFDDGYDDNYRTAFPILRDLGMPAMFFVSTGHIDTGRAYAYDWLVHMICMTRADRLKIPELAIDQPLGDSRSERRALAVHLLGRMKWLDASVQASIVQRLELEWSMPRETHRDCRPMTWDQLREMRSGGMEVGSHGVWHNMLAKLPHDEMVAEIRQSKETLDRELGVPAEVLSYPVGGSDAYDESVMRAAREAGFKVGCSYTSGTSPVPTRAEFQLRRMPVERHMNLAWFASLIGLPEFFSFPARHRIG
ncbi:MAG: polysaccharide deacetylase family protein [Rhodanobacteraceae bacterium]